MSPFFVVSKTIWLLLAPSHLVFEFLVAAAVLLMLGRTRLGRMAALAGVLLYLLFGVLPAGAWLARPLENAYPRPPWPAHVDGVLVLGGGFNTAALLSRDAPGANPAETRLISGYEVARRYPNAKVVFSGGWGEFSDAKAARYAFAQMGLEPSRLVLEDRSRDTLENLVYSRRLIGPRPGEVWLMATSAIHMPRAMQASRLAGWKVTPWATDYATAAQGGGLSVFGNPGLNLFLADQAAHEWLGLLGYRLRRPARG